MLPLPPTTVQPSADSPPERHRFFLVRHSDNYDAATSIARSTSDGKFEMAGDHGALPSCLLIFLIPAMSDATLFCRFGLSGDEKSFSYGASSTRNSGLCLCYSMAVTAFPVGDMGWPPGMPFFRTFLLCVGGGTSPLKQHGQLVWLRLRAPDCAFSQAENARPMAAADR